MDALREEHEQRRQAELMELQRQRQIQMAAKLDVMRHKKHEMLEQQRLMVMQKMEEQRREMEIRRQIQMQQQQSSMVGVSAYGAPISVPYGNVSVSVQQPHAAYNPQQQPQQQQYDAYNASLQQQAYSQVPVATVQPQFPQNPVADQNQYAASQQQSQQYQTSYYNQVVPPQQYGSMVYSHQHPVATAVVPPLQQPQMQHQSHPNMVYQPYAVPSGAPPGVLPGKNTQRFWVFLKLKCIRSVPR